MLFLYFVWSWVECWVLGDRCHLTIQSSLLTEGVHRVRVSIDAVALCDASTRLTRNTEMLGTKHRTASPFSRSFQFCIISMVRNRNADAEPIECCRQTNNLAFRFLIHFYLLHWKRCVSGISAKKYKTKRKIIENCDELIDCVWRCRSTEHAANGDIKCRLSITDRVHYYFFLLIYLCASFVCCHSPACGKRRNREKPLDLGEMESAHKYINRNQQKMSVGRGLTYS